MFGFIKRWRDEYRLDEAILKHEATPAASIFGRRTLRAVVQELRPSMTPGEILGIITLILQLIVEFRGVVKDVVDRVRASRPTH